MCEPLHRDGAKYRGRPLCLLHPWELDERFPATLENAGRVGQDRPSPKPGPKRSARGRLKCRAALSCAHKQIRGVRGVAVPTSRSRGDWGEIRTACLLLGGRHLARISDGPDFFALDQFRRHRSAAPPHNPCPDGSRRLRAAAAALFEIHRSSRRVTLPASSRLSMRPIASGGMRVALSPSSSWPSEKVAPRSRLSTVT